MEHRCGRTIDVAVMKDDKQVTYLYICNRPENHSGACSPKSFEDDPQVIEHAR